MAIFERESCIRGYHVYKEIWDASIGEYVLCEREPFNRIDRYTVAVLKNDTIVGHITKNLSHVCLLFLARRFCIGCIVTGERRYSEDLTQGELEVPYKLIFTGKSKD